MNRITAKRPDAMIWLVQIEHDRYSVTGRGITIDVKDTLSRLNGAFQTERSKTGFKMIIPHSSVSALREQCQASGIPVQMIETDTAPVATSQRQRHTDDGKKRGRFIRFGRHWTFRFDR